MFADGYIWWNIPADGSTGLLTGKRSRLLHKQKGTITDYGQCKQPFSAGSSSDRLTEEQENEIAENIYEWWISGKPYKQWYAENFLQQSFDFDAEPDNEEQLNINYERTI